MTPDGRLQILALLQEGKEIAEIARITGAGHAVIGSYKSRWERQQREEQLNGGSAGQAVEAVQVSAPAVPAVIQKAVDDEGVTAEEVIGTLARQMRGDITRLMPNSPVLRQIAESGFGALVKKIKVREIFRKDTGENLAEQMVEVELYSAQTAAQSLAGILRLADKEQEARVPSVINVQFNFINSGISLGGVGGGSEVGNDQAA